MSSVLLSQTVTIPYQQLPTSTGASTGSSIYFGASMTSSSITITFEGPSDRWIAIGFGTSMTSTDAFIYSNGHSSSVHPLGWYDYYNSSYSSSGVLVDGTQNWNVVSTNTASGQRTVVATRTLNTGDANDVVINFTATALSLVWARGSSASYTIAYHGSSNRANNISLPWLSPPTASFTTLSTSLCVGSSMTYSNISTGGLTTYTWNFAGASPATSTSTNPVVTYTQPGTYSVVLTASNAIGVNTYTQINYVTVTPTISPSLSISQISGSNPICAGSSAGFSAAPANGGPLPSYQWRVNGSNVGTNSSSFSSTSLGNNSTVTCIMTSNALCSSPITATSSAITMSVSSTAPSSLALLSSFGTNPICVGANASFTALPFNGGSTPFYQWKINGAPVGSNTSIYTSNSLINGDIVTCELSSSASCPSSTFAVSSAITMSVNSVLVPNVSASLSSGTNPLCTGALLIFTATATNGGTNPSYQWKINGLNVGTNTSTFSINSLSNSDQLTCVLISGLSCSNPSFATSASLIFTVHPIPNAPQISPSGTLGVCVGGSISLSSSASTGNTWSNNSLTQSITVFIPGNFTVTQTQNGCISAPSSIVTVTLHPQTETSITSAGPFCTDSSPFILQATPLGGTFSGNGVTGNVFSPSNLVQGNNSVTYSFTDSNNCTDTSTTLISVSDCSFIGKQSKVNNAVVLYPNPSIGLITISSNLEKIKTILISDISGRVLLKNSSLNEIKTELDISKEPKGLYFILVVFESGTKQFHVSKLD